MMNNKKLSEVKADVAALLRTLPGGQKKWLNDEIGSARTDPSRDIQTLEMICAALERAVKARANRKPRRSPAKR